MKKNYQAILFDLDNTLLDFSHSEHVSLEKVHAHHFDAHIDDDFPAFKQKYHHINSTLWQQVHLGELIPAEVKHKRFMQLCELYELEHDIALIADHYESQLGENAPWYPGAQETLDILKQHYKIGIVTNGLMEVQRRKYELSGLKHWCKCFIISDEVGSAKPEKKIFEIALAQLNCRAEDTLMVGDSLEGDYQGAIKMGMDFCWVTKKTEQPNPAPKFKVCSVTELLEKLALTEVVD